MRMCPICEKKPVMGGKRNKLRGKFNPTPLVRKYPNLQWAPLPAGGRIKICTRCLKANKHLEVSAKK